MPAMSPGGRHSTTMSFDTVRGVVVLFGGNTSVTSFGSDTWEYSGATGWARVTTAVAPGGRFDSEMSYDAARHVTVLFGGNTSVTGYGSDTWEY